MENRIVWADSLKGVLILLVILGHALQCVLGDEMESNKLWCMIYSFHMPAFIAISGYFSHTNTSLSNRNFWGSIIRRLKQLLVPYFVWSVIHYIKKQDYSLHRIIEYVTLPETSFWFLWVLFWIFVIFQVIRWASMQMKVDEIIIMFLSSLLLIAIMGIYNIRIFGFHLISYYFLFFLLGYCIHRYPVFRTCSRWTIVIAAIVWFFMAWNWSMHNLPNWFPNSVVIPSAILQVLYRGLTACIAIVCIFNIAPLFLNKPFKTSDVIQWLGEYSLGVYVVHLVVVGQTAFMNFINRVIPSVDITFLVFILCLFSVITSSITIKIILLNKTLSRILLGKLR